MKAVEMLNIIKEKDKHYSIFHIPKKSGGTRIIENPSRELKTIQREILDSILKTFPVDKNCHGFVDKRGIITNAQSHVGAVCVINIDLKDFFHTVTKDMVIRELSRFTDTPHAIAELITYKERLPMGAPTSPYMSNICTVILDRKLGGLAKKHNAVYTRYADDLTFSSKTNNDLHKIIPKVHSFIKGEGFVLNYNKTKVTRRGGRMMVTGICVNDRLNVPRKIVKNFRAEVHQTRLSGTQDDLHVLAELKGFASHIYNANPNKGKQYLKKISEL